MAKQRKGDKTVKKLEPICGPIAGMKRFLIELYYTSFVLFFRSGGAKWPTGVNVGKGVAGVAVIQCVFLLSTAAWFDVAARRILIPIPSWGATVVGLILYFVNRYPLVTLGCGIAYERQFTALKKAKRTRLIAGFAALLLIVLAYLISAAIAHRRLFGTTHYGEH